MMVQRRHTSITGSGRSHPKHSLGSILRLIVSAVYRWKRIPNPQQSKLDLRLIQHTSKLRQIRSSQCHSTMMTMIARLS
jgi:hypothetical protein